MCRIICRVDAAGMDRAGVDRIGVDRVLVWKFNGVWQFGVMIHKCGVVYVS
ncbi:hypothetical protein Syun_006943 [Stephania yunnanensis]|uniref:Uncharacterized protein n=1 Tax=Stephania yunnanensis TaxID=152371 RepID=A0AAP0KXG8_9MAGN